MTWARYCEDCGEHNATWEEDSVINGVILEKTDYHCSRCDKIVETKVWMQPVDIVI